MQQSRGLQGIAATLVILACLMPGGCARDTPEQAVRRQVAALQDAIDARDAGAIEALLAEDFVGNRGMDRRGARQLAAASFLRHRDVRARLGPVAVGMRGEGDAVAKFSVLVTGGSGGLLPDSGRVYRVETGWRRIDGDWRLRNASWSATP